MAGDAGGGIGFGVERHRVLHGKSESVEAKKQNERTENLPAWHYPPHAIEFLRRCRGGELPRVRSSLVGTIVRRAGKACKLS